MILDPWIDHQPLRLYDADALAGASTAVGATVVICEADRCEGPVLDLPLDAIGSTRGDPTNVDLPAPPPRASPCSARPAATPTASPS